MKRKIFIFMLTVIMLVFGASFAACAFSCGGGKQSKVELTSDRIVFSDKDKVYEYSGLPIEPEKDIVVLSPKDDIAIDRKGFSFSYSDNINVGTATITVTANEDNKYYYGSASVNFTIEKGAAGASDSEHAAELLSGSNVNKVYLAGDIDFTGMDVTVKSDVEVIYRAASLNSKEPSYDFITGDNFVNNGKIEFEPAPNGYRGTTVIVNGNFENNGEISLGNYCEFYNGGNLQNNGTINSYSLSEIYTNDSEIPNVNKSTGSFQHIRKQITEENILFLGDTVYSPNGDMKQKYKITIDGESPYVATQVEYRNCDRAGTAYLDITVLPTDKNLYGSLSVPYTIKRAKAVVTSIEEINSYQAEGNYGIFTIDEFRVKDGESFTLEEGNEIHATKVYIHGNVQNCGLIEGTEDFIIGTTANFKNSGSIKASKSFSSHSPILNEESGQMELWSAFIESDFENKGKVDFYCLETNDATVLSMSNSSKSENGQGKFINAQTASTVFHGLVMVGGIGVHDFSKPNETFEIEGEFSNIGHVYSHFALPEGIFQNVEVIRDITSDDIVLKNPVVEYDGNNQRPFLNSQESGLKGGEYSLKFFREDGTPLTGYFYLPKDAGKYIAKYTVTSFYTKFTYESSAEVIFEVTPITREATTSASLKGALEDKNCNKVILKRNVEFTHSGSQIREDVTLDLNGFNLIIKGVTLTNYGTIINGRQFDVNNTPTLDDCGIQLASAVEYGQTTGFPIYSGSTLQNEGIIENHNVICVGGESKISGEGTIKNYGLIYRLTDNNFTNTVEDIDGGLFFIRESLSDAQKDGRVTLDYTYTYYDKTEKKPDFHIFKNGEEVEKEGRFEVTYNYLSIATDNIAEHNAWATITVLDDFDKDFSGHVTLSFTILRSEIEVSTTQELKDAIADKNYIGYKIKPTYYNSYFDLTENLTMRTDVETYIDLGQYDIKTDNASKISFLNNSYAKLYATADSFERLQKMVYWADRVTLTADITPSASKSIELSFTGRYSTKADPRYDKIFYGKALGEIKVDLNGYDIKGQFKVTGSAVNHSNLYYEYTLILTDSSEQKSGVIGGDSGAGLVLDNTDDGQDYFSVKLDGIKVRGGVQGTEKVKSYLEVNDCDTNYTGE